MISHAEVLAGLYEKQVPGETEIISFCISFNSVLESSAVQHLLREHFVSTWALVVDLKVGQDILSLLRSLVFCPMQAIIGNQSAGNVLDAQRAKHALDNYSFPVQSMVQKSDGTVISKVNANDLLNMDSTSEQFVNL